MHPAVRRFGLLACAGLLSAVHADAGAAFNKV